MLNLMMMMIMMMMILITDRIYIYTLKGPPAWHFKNTQPFRNSAAEQRQGFTDILITVVFGQYGDICLWEAHMNLPKACFVFHQPFGGSIWYSHYISLIVSARWGSRWREIFISYCMSVSELKESIKINGLLMLMNHDFPYQTGPWTLGVLEISPFLDQLTSVRVGLLLAFSDSTADPTTTVGELLRALKERLGGWGWDGCGWKIFKCLTAILDMLKMVKILQSSIQKWPCLIIFSCGTPFGIILWQWKCAWFCIAIGWISRPTCPKKGQGSARKKTLYRFIGNPQFW